MRFPSLCCALLLVGCATYNERLEPFREAYESARFEEAEAEIEWLIDGSGPEDGDAVLYLLEKAMLELSRGRPEAAIPILRSCRDELDVRFDSSRALSTFGSTFTDDTYITYKGAAYEHVLVRVLLCLAELATGGPDAYAYAIQIGEMQERILADDYGEEVGYQPRQQYRRVAAGAYLQGVVREAVLDASEAEKIYARALDYEPGLQLAQRARERLQGGAFAAPGHGIVHVFYLAGRGPLLVETSARSTSTALRIAGIAAALLTGVIAPAGQANVPVPELIFRDNVRTLAVRAGGTQAQTSELLDVYRVARQSLDAEMPMIMARALLRRAAKTAVTTTAEVLARQEVKKEDRWIISLLALFANIAWTATERADTRLWSSLPASIQSARLELPAGVHTLDLGDGNRVPVRVSAGQVGTVLLLRPNLALPGRLVVDPYSRVSQGNHGKDG